MVPYGSSSASDAPRTPVCPEVVAVAPLIERKDDGPPSPNWSDSGASTAEASSEPRRLRVYETSSGANIRAMLGHLLESEAENARPTSTCVPMLVVCAALIRRGSVNDDA